MMKKYLGLLSALVFVGVTHAIGVWEDPDTPNELVRSFYLVTGDDWLFATKEGGSWHMAGVSTISTPAAQPKGNRMNPMVAPRRALRPSPFVIVKPNLAESTVVPYQVSAEGDFRDADGTVVPLGRLLAHLQKTQPDKAAFFEIRLTARNQIHLAYAALDALSRYGAGTFIVRIPPDDPESAELKAALDDAGVASSIHPSHSEAASSPSAGEDAPKADVAAQGSLLPPPHPGQATGPKNRLELAQWLTPRCIADLPKGDDVSAAAEWIKGAVGWWLYQDDAPTSAELMAQAESLGDAYRQSPAIKIWLGLMRYAQPTKTRDVRLLTELQNWIYAPSGSPAVQWLAAVAIKDHVGPRPLENTSRAAAALRSLGRSFREECKSDRERWLVLTLPNRGYNVELPFDIHINYPAATADFPAVIRDTLVGIAESDRGFNLRGTSLPDDVTPEERKQFLAHMRLARKALMRAWELDKTVPHAAAAMPNVCLAEQGVGEPALWLRRATDAQVDCLSAWTGYFNGRRPRWGWGSLDEIMSATEEISTGMRWDTDLPLVFEKAFDYLGDDVMETPEVLKSPRARAAWNTFQGSLPDRYPSGSRCVYDRANSWAFGICWALLDYEVGGQIAARINWRLCEELESNYTGGASSFESVRAEFFLRSGKLGPAFIAAEETHAGGRYPDAAHLYRQLVEQTQDPATRERLEKRAAVTEVESALEKTLDSPITAASFRHFFVARQGAFGIDQGLSQLVALPQQHSIATIWLSSRTKWRLDVTIDTGDQPTAETGVFFGHHNQGAGVSVGLTRGSANLRLRQLNRVLIGEVLEQPQWSPTRERKFSLSWNGSELTIRGSVGGKAWVLPSQQIEAEPGVWILALTSGGNLMTNQGKSDALESPVIREFRFSRIRPDSVQF